MGFLKFYGCNANIIYNCSVGKSYNVGEGRKSQFIGGKG